MARSARDRQRISRERQRKGLYRAVAWLDRRAIERAIDCGAISERGSEDPERLGELAAMVFLEWAENSSRRDT